MNLPAYFLADLPPEAPMTPTLVAEACQALRRNRARQLAGRSARQAIDLLSRVAGGWLDPEDPFRRLALEHGPAATGFSAKTLAAGLDAFFQQITRENLEALIEQDLGHPERLDRFISLPSERPNRRTSRARGPELMAHITAGNLPNPAFMSVVLGMLTGSSQFVKCASGASLLPRLFAHSIYAVDPKIGSCLEVAEWTGGHAELESTLFSHADLVTATGDDDTLLAIQRRIPSAVRLVGYGHRLSFAYVTRESLAREAHRLVAARAAVDVAAWDQFGCLSPHQIFVEDQGSAAAEDLAQCLAEELQNREVDEPRGILDPATAAAIAARRALYEVRAAVSENTRVWKSLNSTAWTVVFEADSAWQTSPLGRFIHLTRVGNLEEALRLAEPVKGKVSTVGLEALGDRAPQLAQQLAAWGVSRICPVGQMQHPPLGWRHDGRPCLGELVTWTDWEQG